jgi:NADPH:quinone reductase-like Zn-dependent oxidoreductase
MRAVRIHAYGDPSVLQYEEAPDPTIGRDDVLVRVHAAAVNPVDWAIRYGYLAQWFSHSLPLILGCDVSGEVEAIGGDVVECAVGDEVYARTDLVGDGTYAEYVAVRAADVAPKPPGLDHVQAAAIPHAALTAWQALFDHGQLAEGQMVLIHAAAGGVGSFAVQLAKWRGAKVVGTASANHLAFLDRLGVDEAIDYTAVHFEDVVKEADVVLDAVGGETQKRSWTVLKPGGVLVSLVEPPSEETAAAHGVRVAMVATRANASQLTELAGLVSSGALEPFVSTVLPLAEVREAHRLSETRHTQGKIVLQVA